MKPTLNHVALLTASVENSAKRFTGHGLVIGPAQDWPGEGTKEIYVGDTNVQRSLLLLMEPTRDGSYQKALTKRGPGLHHIAIDVPNLKTFLSSLSGTGWFLLPSSIQSVESHNTAWLARPGFPALIEAQERTDMAAREQAVIARLEIPNLSSFTSLVSALQIDEIQASPDNETWLTLQNGQRLALSEVVGHGSAMHLDPR